jgi:DNA replication protein DnaC
MTLSQLRENAWRKQWTYGSFLQQVLGAELEGREYKANAQRLKAVRLPGTKMLDTFDFSFAIKGTMSTSVTQTKSGISD